MGQKFKCKNCGGWLVMTMGLHGSPNVKDFPELMNEARDAQRAHKMELRHLTGGCNNPEPKKKED